MHTALYIIQVKKGVKIWIRTWKEIRIENSNNKTKQKAKNCENVVARAEGEFSAGMQIDFETNFSSKIIVVLLQKEQHRRMNLFLMRPTLAQYRKRALLLCDSSKEWKKTKDSQEVKTCAQGWAS